MKKRNYGKILACVMALSINSTSVTNLSAEDTVDETTDITTETGQNDITDLNFTSEVESHEIEASTENTEMYTAEEDGTPVNTDEDTVSSDMSITPTTEYNEDKSMATLTLECADTDKNLNLTEDCLSFYEDVFVNGLLTKVDSEKNQIKYETSENGVWSFDVDITDDEGNVLSTQTLRFKVLEIEKTSIDEVSTQDTEGSSNEVATQATTSTVTASHDSKSIGISYTSNGSYSWTIPSSIDLNNQNTLTVSATKINEEANASLKIKVNSANDFKLVTSNGQSGTYTISKDGNPICNNSIVLETTEKGTTTTDLKFNADPANFMIADKYNDTLTFTAQNGYASGTILEVDGYKFIVMSQTDNDKYLVVDGQSIGNIQFQPNQDSEGNYYNIGKYDGNDLPNKRYDGQNSNVYEDSYIDKYLEETWFKSLPEDLQKAIVPTEIKQAAYSINASNPKWRWFNADDTHPSSAWYYNEGTTENPNWVIWNKANIPDDETGIYPLSGMVKKDKGYNGQSYNTITRHVFLPSVEEVANLVDLNNANKIYSFLKGTNNSLNHMWLRDTNAGSPRFAVNLDYYARSLYYDDVSYTWIGVRPAFVLDLSSLGATVSGNVSYK